MAAIATSAASSTLTKSGAAAAPRPSVPNITRVAIRDGKTVSINDYVYVSTPWAPGAGEPYIIARVMEFVLASSSRKGAQALASSSGTLQVRVNLYLRQRDITHRTLHDPRLLVATMHSDVFALENIRGLCIVRHRDLIGDAPAVSAWKRKDDHFYYHQLFDRYLHKFYDVIPTDRVRNAPEDVLAVLRQRYSFIVAEIGLAADLCGALRACTVCEKWAASAESVRCDTCKLFFHMGCLTPPLASKPAKGYSWTCAPCSKRREQSQDGLVTTRSSALESSGASNGASTSAAGAAAGDVGVSRLPGNQGSLRAGPGTRGRGRGRGGWQGGRKSLLQGGERASTASRESTPQPGGLSLERRTVDDERGTRSFQRWPYRYFGEHTLANDVLDPDDSIYPRATPRIGVKYQANPIAWDEQQALGMGVHSYRPEPVFEGSGHAPIATDDPPAKPKRPPGRPPKKKKEEMSGQSTPVLSMQPLSAEPSPGSGEAGKGSGTGTPEVATSEVQAPQEAEVERGLDSSVEVIYKPGVLSGKLVDRYVQICTQQFPQYRNHVGLLDRSLKTLMECNGDGVRALAEMSKSTSEELEVVSWSSKEAKALEKTVLEVGAEMRTLKRAVPTKKPGEIVRHFYQWKCTKLKEQFEEQRRLESSAEKGAPPVPDHSTRAVSPSMSLWDDGDGTQASSAQPNASNGPSFATSAQQQARVCKMCAATSSSVWYKGPYSWVNRRLCVDCGLYWRKYAAETPTEIVTRKREHAADDAALGVAPPVKALKTSRTDSVKGSPAVATPPPTSARILVARERPSKCSICKAGHPLELLKECEQCSLSVHQGCYGLVNEEVNNHRDPWYCDACSNERSLDAALVPRCILCPPPPRMPAPPPPEAIAPPPPRKVGRPPKNPPPSVPRDPVAAAAAAAYKSAVSAPLSQLDAFKPTECNNWVHLVCATYIPEILFTDPLRMKPIEGAGNLPRWRYEALCDLCKKHEGACVSCAEPACKRTFHVSCASQQPKFSMGLDMTPVKVSRRDTVTTANFQGETGHLTAVVYCDAHKDVADSRELIGMYETDDEHEPLQRPKEELHESDQGDLTNEDGLQGAGPPLTAAQIYAVSHKNVRSYPISSTSATAASLHPDANTYPLLRRAKRFDGVFGGWPGSTAGRRSTTAFAHSSVRTSARPSLEGMHSAPTDGDTSNEVKTSPAGTRNGNVVKMSVALNGRHHDHDSASPSTSDVENRQRSTACVRCGTAFSPYWWDVPRDVDEQDEDEPIHGQDGHADAHGSSQTPKWLLAYRARASSRHVNGTTSPPDPQSSNSARGLAHKKHTDALCVRCRHAVRPPLAT